MCKYRRGQTICFIVKREQKHGFLKEFLVFSIRKAKDSRWRKDLTKKSSPLPLIYMQNFLNKIIFLAHGVKQKNLIIKNTRDGSCKNHYNQFVNLFFLTICLITSKKVSNFLRRTNRERIHACHKEKICRFWSCTAQTL